MFLRLALLVVDPFEVSESPIPTVDIEPSGDPTSNLVPAGALPGQSLLSRSLLVFQGHDPERFLALTGTFTRLQTRSSRESGPAGTFYCSYVYIIYKTSAASDDYPSSSS